MNKNYQISGKVIDKQTGKGIPGLRIEAWDKDLIIDDLLGMAASDENGFFIIRFEDRYYKEIVLDRRPDIYFKVYKEDRLLLDTSDHVMWNVKDDLDSVVLQVPPEALAETPSSGESKISGRISSDKSPAVPGIKVFAYDKRISGDVVIGKAVTDKEGNYTIFYNKDILQGKVKPDIEIRLMDTVDSKKEIGRSAVRYNAGDDTKFNISLESAKIPRQSEFDRLLAVVKPHLENKKLSDLSENNEKKDITFLANKTRWDARTIAMVAQAEKLSLQTRIPPAHYYALFRSGVAGTRESINKLTPQFVENAIKKAIAENVIPDSGNIGETLKLFKYGNNEYLLSNSAPSAVSSLDSMLSLGLKPAQKSVFIECYQEFRDNPAGLWAALKDRGFEDETIAKLKLDGKLGYLTMQNAQLVQRLYDEVKLSNNQRISDPADLVLAGLYKASTWENLIGKDVPEGVKRDEYASSMANQLILSYPTLVTAEMVKNGEITLENSNLREENKFIREELYDFLSGNHLEYTIGVQPISSWNRYQELKPEVQRVAKKVERLYQLTPSNESMSVLSKTPVNSAYQIMKYTREEFIQEFGKNLKNLDAELIYTKAHEIYSTTLNIATAYLTNRMMPNVYAISGVSNQLPRRKWTRYEMPKSQGEKGIAASGGEFNPKENKNERTSRDNSDEIIDYPTLDELLGDMDYCSCDHCKSVLSPAAYLVELLQFIDLEKITHEKSNPIVVLNKRRPDIQHIQLTCENTNTVLPYIDLVNEILEHYILNGNLDSLVGHDINENVNPNDLLADPQYVEDKAYEKVKKEVFPYTLPFDRPLEALRLLFRVWDASLEEALGIFGDSLAAVKEILGLNAEEFQILTDKSFRDLSEYFGLLAGTNLNEPIANDKPAIANAKTFSKTVDITNKELIALLKTQFINPGVSIIPKLERLNLSFLQIKSFFELNISIKELSMLLPANINIKDYCDFKEFNTKNKGEIVAGWLNRNKALIMGMITLADLTPGSEECSLANVELRYTFPDMDHNKLEAISYHKLHRFIRLWKKEGWSIETTDKIITAFLLSPSQAIKEDNIDAEFTILLARMANFKKLVKDRSITEDILPKWLTLWDSSKDLDTRRAALADLILLNTDDILDFTTITGIDPLADDFQEPDPSLLKFLRIRDDLKSIPLKLADLNYILMHKDPEGKLTPEKASEFKTIKIVRDALAAVTSELSLVPDNADLAYAKTKMALVYDKTVVNTFFELLTNEKIFETDLELKATKLPENILDKDSNLGYEPFKKLLTYKGRITITAKSDLLTENSNLVEADLEAGEVLADFRPEFAAALDKLYNAGNDAIDALDESYPGLKGLFNTVSAKSDTADKIKTLLDEIFPELRIRLKKTGLTKVLSDSLKCTPEIADALISSPGVMKSEGDPASGIIQDFLRLEELQFVSTADKPRPTFDFYLDPPATDNYNICIKAPENSKVSLIVDAHNVFSTLDDDTTAAKIGATGEIKNIKPVMLTAGSLVQLTVSDLPEVSKVELFWQTKGMAKQPVPDSRIYLKETVDTARNALVRLQKAIQLQQLFKLTAAELIYFASVNAETIGMLNLLKTTDTISVIDLHDLWKKVYLLVFFTQLKNENEPEENTWIKILQNPDIQTPQKKSLLLGVCYWKEDDLNAILANGRFMMTHNQLSCLSNLKRVKCAMDFIARVGYPASDVIRWATAIRDNSLIQSIKDSIRIKCDDAAWLDTMQSVSDPLRNKSRDALVTYILYHDRPSDEIDTADKLYEYFLVDVSMDACMKTSRIRLALSTVQLFIQRCLMNLEPDVLLPATRAKQWEWMKRYRVWEANRKVFLYPENWLEPELRDNKSQFFTELEGELLKADITDELAEVALLNYLKKLDDVARLEIVGMYLEEDEDSTKQDDDIIHVFGRTNGHTRQYYYRRYNGTWSPWEKISVTIEGDYLFPVIWKTRLFIFWLSCMEKPADPPTNDGTKELSARDLADEPWKSINKINVEINMCWAEYFKGKWTLPKSSELKTPVTLKGLSNPFEPRNVVLFARKFEINSKASKRLIFYLFYSASNQKDCKYSTITFTSKNAPPIVENGQGDRELNNSYVFNYKLFRQHNNNCALNAGQIRVWSDMLKLSISQPPPINNQSVIETVLTRKDYIGNFNLLPINHVVSNAFEAPFFYSDEHSTFFIRAHEKLTPALWEYEEYYPWGEILPGELEIPPLEEYNPIPDWGPGPVINPWEEVVLPEMMNVVRTSEAFVSEMGTFGSGGSISGNSMNFKTNIQ